MGPIYRTYMLSLVLSATLGQGTAAMLYVGANATVPDELIRVLATDGTVMDTFGTHPSSAAAVNGTGLVFTVTPEDSISTIYIYDETQTEVGSFVFTGGIDNGNGSPGYITDLAWGGSDTLWLSGYNGIIYHVDLTGALLSSFDSGNLWTGVATDGSSLYTTSGLGLLDPASTIYQWDFGGSLLGTIQTPLNDTLGLGYDSSTGSFWVGGLDTLANVNALGALIGSPLSASGAISGVEFGDLITAVPEPGAFVLVGAGLLLLGGRRWRKRKQGNGSVAMGMLPLLAVALIQPSADAAVVISSVTPNVPSPQMVGTPVTFTAAASDTDAGTLWYRFSVKKGAGPFETMIDYGPENSYSWVNSDSEASFTIQATVRNIVTGSTASSAVGYTSTSRVSGATPVISPTAHPLVALYSVPPCAAGGRVRVRFKRAADSFYQSTALKNCDPAVSSNFYIAGMRPSSTYEMRHDILAGPRLTTVAGGSFTTGSAAYTMPATTVQAGPSGPNTLVAGLVFNMPLNNVRPYATDQAGNLVWYLPSPVWYGVRPAPGGGVMVLYGGGADLPNSGFREVDLAGNTIKQTNVARIREQLTQRGDRLINVVHHEARRLANGHYLVLGMTDMISDAQGPGVDIVGDMILELDSNLNVVWTWDAFDHLDVTRKAVLNETCSTGVAGCVVLNAPMGTGNDWTHCNSVAQTPDGNMVLSCRHQDMIYKISRATGSVIWKLGKDGDFSWNSSDPWPWFSHGHDAEYDVSNNTLTYFDNGNARVLAQGGNSRGQVLQIDEVNRVVTPLLNVDLGTYSLALGSAERLPNGGYHFHSGLTAIAGAGTNITEFSSSGALNYRLSVNQQQYRSFRLRDMYSEPY